MDKSRNYILDRLKSKTTSIEEFNFDSLQAPPLHMFLGQMDIQELFSIATSLKYSAKPEVRYSEIDRVCRRRGLVKFAAGTNRVVYRHPEFPDYLFKIAADDVGMRDNPAEFRNQMLLKPFVTKCFEISPCGTVAIVEKVNPITSREEYLSVADDVFELLNTWVIGKYVVADCGSRFFMNIGIRKGFGPVLLDYPYLYELDGDKLFCNKDDPTSITGKCDGVIDYDAGYNFLRCTKCGAIYKAKELEKKIKDNELIVEKEGSIKMEITISGGSNNVVTTIDTSRELTSPSLNSLVNNINVSVSPSSRPVEDKTPEVVVTPVEREPKTIVLDMNDTNDDDNTPDIEVVKEDVVVADVEAKVIDEETPTIVVNKSVNGVPTEAKSEKKVEARKPVSFSEATKQEALAAAASKKEVTASPVEIVERSIKTILENIDKIDIEAVRIDTLNRLFDSIVTLMGNNLDVYELLASTLLRLYSELEDDDYVSACANKDVLEIFRRVYTNSVEVTSVERSGNDINLSYVINSSVLSGNADEDGNPEMVNLLVAEQDTIVIEGVYSDDSSKENGENTLGLKLYDAVTVSINELFPDEQPRNVLAITDGNGKYITNRENEIITIDTVDNKSLQAHELVSKKWLENVITALEDIAEAGEEEESMTVEEFLASEEAAEEETVVEKIEV